MQIPHAFKKRRRPFRRLRVWLLGLRWYGLGLPGLGRRGATGRDH